MRCIAIDQQGHKWLGTEGRGVIEFDDTANSWITHFEPGGFIWDIHVAVDGTVWVGSEFSGLSKFDGTTWTHISGLPDWEVRAVTTDQDGTVWAGTYRAGLARYDGHTWAVFDTTNSDIPSNWVSALAVDDENTLWVGSVNIWYKLPYI